MGVLEGVVIIALMLAGAYVGYHAWQDSLNEPIVPHQIDLNPVYYVHEAKPTPLIF